ncbi:HAMP domain-containing sensor histidine kinase [Sporosarcina sp. YIM B06819]|uniref:sensor histidine kinase n=1 Tax=Sporosarcina sp. YIM B06819 TaxID=3081769 RepID=UPI00298C0584|nr:HAMP domain-containing sensor histidine kinase [Sporosarcina sp. YIM B06819]
MKGVLRVVEVIVLTITLWSLAFIGTSFINRQSDLHMSEYSTGLLTLIVMFFLFTVIMLLFSKFAPPRRMDFLTAMIDAMKQISKGDYTIKLANQFEHKKNHPFGKIVEGINEMAVELNQIEEMRQEFISNVSHEIQSPLASINGFANVLKQNHLTVEEREHYLGIIEMESLRLANLSDNLLKLTSIESQHHPFEPMPYRLDKQIRTIILSCEPQWLAKSLELDIALDEVEIKADQELMSQVWINLIINSIKFTSNGGTLKINLYQRNKDAIVEITDSGMGIAEEHQAHLFERFYKVDVSRNRKLGGSGLGLSITKKIIDMHEGSIHVQSAVDEGTTFTVTLQEKV